jgi:hypothetical protein
LNNDCVVGSNRTFCLLLLRMLLLLLPGQSGSGVLLHATRHKTPALPCLQHLLECWCGSSSIAPLRCQHK